MEIKNAKIKNVTVDFWGTQSLQVRLEVETQDLVEPIIFNCCNYYDLQLFNKIREYTEAEKIDQMKGKIIRLVYFSDIREAFGDAICDKFVYLKKSRNEGETIKELSKSDLQAKYRKLSSGEL